MQEENVQNVTTEQIIQNIENIYKSSSTESTRQSEQWIVKKGVNDGFLGRLFELIMPSCNLVDLKLATSIIIKKIVYNIADSPRDKAPYIAQLYKLIMTDDMPIKVKQSLATSIQHLLNKDSQNKYKPYIFQKLFNDLQNSKNPELMAGLFIINISCVNSLSEVQQIITYLLKMLTALHKNTLYLIEILQTYQNKQNVIKCLQTIFQFIQIAIERIVDEEDSIQAQVEEIRKNNQLLQMINIILKCLMDGNNIISKMLPQINHIKKIVMQTIFVMLRYQKLPEWLFIIVYNTFTNQVQSDDDSEDVQHILVICMEILQNQLSQKYYYSYFISHKLEIIFALLFYCRTTSVEIDEMNDNPAKFLEIAQDFSEAQSSSTYVKVRAACLLKVLAKNIDDAPRNILEILIITISSSLSNPSISTQAIKDAQQAFSHFRFSHMQPSSKIQISFNILTIISPIITKRQDLCNVVYAMMITNLQNFAKLNNVLVIVRLIRLIGYYPSAIYFSFAKLRMAINTACTLEALKMFDRVLKGAQYPQIYQLLGEICYDLLDSMEVTDSISHTLILNNYDKIISPNQKLFLKTLKKLVDTFKANYLLGNQKAFISLNFLCSLLKMEKNTNYRNVIINQITIVVQYCINHEQYNQKIIQFYSSMLQFSPIVDEKVERYGLDTLKNIQTFGNNSLIFKFYNDLFIKIDNQRQKIQPYFCKFIQLLFKQNIQDPTTIFQQLCFLLGQIIVTFNNLPVKQQYIINLLTWASKLFGEYRVSILCLILQFIYSQPSKIKQILIKNNLYEQTLKFILSQNYQGKLPRKILVLAMTQLLEIQQKYFKDIIMICLKYLKVQDQINHVKINKKDAQDIKLRKKDNRQPNSNSSDQQFIEPPIKEKQFWGNYLQSFKHPIYSVSEYQLFKLRIWQNGQIVDTFTNEQKQQLRKVMDTDWWHGRTRVIVKVKR